MAAAWFLVGAGCGGGAVESPGRVDAACNCCDIGIPVPMVPPEVVIALDTSATMSDPLDASGSKWAAATAAINAAVTATDTTVNWGLAFMGDTAEACGTGGIALPLGESRFSFEQELRDRTSSVLAGAGARPMRAAIEAAAVYLAGREPGPNRIIMLITDGPPECKAGAPDVHTDDASGALRAVSSAARDYIETSVVGLATVGGPADQTLNDLAAAGGSVRATSPPYTPAASAADVERALHDLTVPIAGCTFPIPPPPSNDGTQSRGDIAVTADGARVAFDVANGWTYTDASLTGLQLHGTACDAVRNGSIETISVVFICHPGT